MTSASIRQRLARMRWVRAHRAILAVGVVLAASAIPAWRAMACSCAGGELPDMIRTADIAFVGVPERSAELPRAELGPRTRFAFAVERASRQVGSSLEVVAWSGSGAGCGIDIALGEEWLVLASDMNGQLETHLCSGSSPLQALPAGELARLERLLPVVPEPTVAPEPGALEAAGPAIGILAVALLLGAASLVAFRRRS